MICFVAIALTVATTLPLSIASAQDTTGAIAGTVRDSTGRPIGYARVDLVGTSHMAQAARDGSYQLTDLRPGIYRLRVRFLGYRPTQRDSLQVRGGETTQIDLVLRRGENCDLDCNPVIMPAPTKRPH